MRSEAEVADAYDAYGRELYGVARRMLRDDGRAADAVQETFVRAWRAADRFDPATASLRTWLHAINRNVVIDQIRARAARPRLAAVGEDGRVPVDDAPPFDEGLATRALLGEAIALLPEAQRQAIVAIHSEGRSAAELARELDVPPATIRSRVHRGLLALREELEGGPAHG